MRITIDVDSQGGQPTVSTQSATSSSAAASLTMGGGLNGGPARGTIGALPSGPSTGSVGQAKNGGIARSGGVVRDLSAMQPRDAGAAPAV